MQGLLNINQPVAGKTGTTEEYRDLWFCGYTPQLSVSIWCGYRTDEPVYIGRAAAHPDGTACPIFASFVNAMLENTDRMEWPSSDQEPQYRPNSEWQFSNTDPSISSQENGSSNFGNTYGNDWNNWNNWNNWNTWNNYGVNGYGTNGYDATGYGTGYGTGTGTGAAGYGQDYDAFGYGTGTGTGTGVGTGTGTGGYGGTV